MRGVTEPARLRAFTLTELLVTLVIMLLLMALVLPALRGATETRRQVACASHLREAGLATLLYAYRHDSRFPPMFFSFSPAAGGEVAVEIVPREASASGLDLYTRRDELVCPSDEQPGTVPVQRQTGGVEHQPMSYGYNIALLLEDARLDQLMAPSDTVVFYDGSMSGSGTPGRNVEGTYSGGVTFARRASAPRHDQRMNAVFADWHVQQVQTMTEQTIRPDKGRASGAAPLP